MDESYINLLRGLAKKEYKEKGEKAVIKKKEDIKKSGSEFKDIYELIDTFNKSDIYEKLVLYCCFEDHIEDLFKRTFNALCYEEYNKETYKDIFRDIRDMINKKIIWT